MNGIEQCLYSALYSYWHNVIHGGMSSDELMECFVKVVEIRNKAFNDYVEDMKNER